MMILIDLLLRICTKWYDRFRICARIFEYLVGLINVKAWNQVRWMQLAHIDCPSCFFPIHCEVCGSNNWAVGMNDHVVCSNVECQYGRDNLPVWEKGLIDYE